MGLRLLGVIMYPVICEFGPVKIFSYGLMVALAVVICALLLSRDARAHKINPDIIFDWMFGLVVSGIIGARIFFIFLNLDYFSENPLEIIMVQKGGLAWQGSLVFGSLFGIVYLKMKKLPMLMMMDLAAPYIALGQAIGRIGCFLNGCCYGRPVSWGVFFPVHGEHLHPTQLYATAGLVVIFCICKIFQRGRVMNGRVFALYLILASVQRFVVEFFRADHSVMAAGLSIFQIVTLGVLTAGMIAFIIFSRRPAR